MSSPGHAVDGSTAALAGHDVGRVRIHADAPGDRSARRLGALGYTFGSDVVLRTDRAGDRTLLAHELAHTGQQAGGPPVLQLQDDPEEPQPEEPATEEPDADVVQEPDTAPAAPAPEPAPAPAPAAPAGLSAKVGRHGVNAVADVILVQDRLVALGVLAAADQARERPADAATVTEDQLTATIAAIETFQQPLGVTDGNIEPGGRTWRALMRLDAASYAASVQAWQERQQRAAATPPAPPAPPQSRADVAAGLLKKYGSGMNDDADGLGTALGGLAPGDPALVPVVLDGVSWWTKDNVAYAATKKMTDAQLAALPSTVRDRLVTEMSGGFKTTEETAQIARLGPAATKTTAKLKPPAGEGFAQVRDDKGGVRSPIVDGATFDERVNQIRSFYDKHWVSRASTGDCHQASKQALEKMGYTVGGGDTTQFPTPIGATPLTAEQNAALRQRIISEVEAGHPIEIGVDYEVKAEPYNVDKKTDHWLYVVATTHDDSGELVLIAYDNADVASSKITKGNVVFFRLDDSNRFQHPAYYPTSPNPFSNEPHFIVNVRPVQVPPAK